MLPAKPLNTRVAWPAGKGGNFFFDNHFIYNNLARKIKKIIFTRKKTILVIVLFIEIFKKDLGR